jgi:hypothetical protein
VSLKSDENNGPTVWTAGGSLCEDTEWRGLYGAVALCVVSGLRQATGDRGKTHFEMSYIRDKSLRGKSEGS